MARRRYKITFKAPEEARLPDALTPGAGLLLLLDSLGRLEPLAQVLHIRRQGGYCGFDVWLFLFLFLGADPRGSIKDFWELVKRHGTRLAALARRRQLPSTASISRALDAVEPELLRPAAEHLLITVSGIDLVLRHPAVRTYDTTGQDWHVFDCDPTVTTLRQRALPQDPSLPEPRRRAEKLGAPGHSGRKRGEIQFRRVTVQHAGSGAWLHAHLSEGNGDRLVDLELALTSVLSTCERLAHPLSRALVRLDGEYGNVPCFTLLRQLGLPFITRINRAGLYEDPAILERLRKAVWYQVPDSLSGPRRGAADLGLVTLAPGKQTKRLDGTPYLPVKVRVVACRFPTGEGKSEGREQRGQALDGWRVELFAVDLPDDAFPAPEAIAMYFGRAAEENRFAQEDRELGLDRIVSYHLPGQEFALLTGLSIWNLKLAQGFALSPPPETRSVVTLRKAEEDRRAAPEWPRDPVVQKTLSGLPWPELLASHPEWRWDEPAQELRCPENRPMTLTSVRTSESGKRSGLIFRRPTGGCQCCDSREDCLRSERREAVRHLELSVVGKVGARLAKRLKLIRGKSIPRAYIAPLTRSPGSIALADSLFLPARARQGLEALFEQASLTVEVLLPKRPERKLTLVAESSAERQHRRLTWEVRLAHNALPDEAEVTLELSALPALRKLLGEEQPRRRTQPAAG
jgi:hypothetical protein